MQNNNTIDKDSVLCRLLTIYYPLNSLTLSRMYCRYVWHLKHDIERTHYMSVQGLRSFKCKFHKIDVCSVNAAFWSMSYQYKNTELYYHKIA